MNSSSTTTPTTPTTAPAGSSTQMPVPPHPSVQPGEALEALEASRTKIREAGETLRQDLKACGDQVRLAAGDICSAAGSTAGQIRQQAETAFSEARKHAGTLCEQGEDYVRQNPLPSVLAALAAGFLVGVLIRR